MIGHNLSPAQARHAPTSTGRETPVLYGVGDREIRKRSAFVQVLQNTLARMRNLIEAHAFEYRGHPGGATGMLVKDYRGKNAEQEIWKFDSALVAQINDVLKQAAIEEGQWSKKRQLSSEVGISEITRRLNAGRDRCAAAKRARDAAATVQ